MKTQNNSATIKEIANQIVDKLLEYGFVIQRYDSCSSNSVYLKLDFGVCNSIRISDHKGKKHLCYRYNIIIDCSDNIVEEQYMRYYFNHNNVTGLVNQIIFDKMSKIKKYGMFRYNQYMASNMGTHKNDDGFWKNAKLITKNKT